MYIHVF